MGEATVEGPITENLPKRLVSDMAYDSDRLDEELKEKHGIEMIAPNRRNRRKTQDGRQLPGIIVAGKLKDFLMVTKLSSYCHEVWLQCRELFLYDSAGSHYDVFKFDFEITSNRIYALYAALRQNIYNLLSHYRFMRLPCTAHIYLQ